MAIFFVLICLASGLAQVKLAQKAMSASAKSLGPQVPGRTSWVKLGAKIPCTWVKYEYLSRYRKSNVKNHMIRWYQCCKHRTWDLHERLEQSNSMIKNRNMYLTNPCTSSQRFEAKSFSIWWLHGTWSWLFQHIQHDFDIQWFWGVTNGYKLAVVSIYCLKYVSVCVDNWSLS